MKKITAFLLAMVMMVGMLGGFSMASSEVPVTIYLDGEKVEFADAVPVHTGTRVLVPVRGFFEKIGVTVDWNSGDKVVIVKDDSQEIMLEVGNSAVLNNGAVEYLDCSVISKDSRTYIPLRYVSESFGYNVQWNGTTKSVHITKGPGNTGGELSDTKDLPTVGSLENLYQLLRYNDKMAGHMYYNFDVLNNLERDFTDTEPAYTQDDSSKADAPRAAAPPESNAAAGADFSGTNNQVEGIEEADLIKTDGKYLYIAQKNKVIIVNADPNNMKVISEIPCSSGVSEIFIYNDKLILINGRSSLVLNPRNVKEGRIFTELFGSLRINSTNVKVYDITNRATPVTVSDKDYEGSYISSRMIEDDLYMVTNARVRFYADFGYDEIIDILSNNNKKAFMQEIAMEGEEAKEFLDEMGFVSMEELYDTLRSSFENYVTPRYRDNKAGRDYEISLDKIPYFKDMVRPNYMMTIGIDVDSGKDDVSAYLGSSGQLYVSADDMYTTLASYEYNVLKSKLQKYPVYDYLTSVHRFGLRDGKITYEARGKIPGTILNQFSMDEYKGVFRIATTTDSNRSSSENNVYSLDESMKIIGRLEGIAPGEKIYSTRFAGERIYMVTFRQMDPFFVIDAANPKKLSVLGYLKIPGFSSYMHILDKDHVLGFGYDTDDRQGWGIDTTGFKLSLFDVSDVAKPVEVKNEIIGELAESPVGSDHKALMISLDKGIMGFPLIYLNSDSDYFVGYYLYNVSSKDFSFKGRVSHIAKDSSIYDVKEDDIIYRGVYINDYLYTFSENKLQAYDLGTLKVKGSISIK